MTDVSQGWDAAINLDASLLTTMAKNFSAGAEDPTIPLKLASLAMGCVYPGKKDTTPVRICLRK